MVEVIPKRFRGIIFLISLHWFILILMSEFHFTGMKNVEKISNINLSLIVNKKYFKWLLIN